MPTFHRTKVIASWVYIVNLAACAVALVYLVLTLLVVQ
jgi:hypothetical protein